jgi:hypothetical protein
VGEQLEEVSRSRGAPQAAGDEVMQHAAAAAVAPRLQFRDVMGESGLLGREAVVEVVTEVVVEVVVK